MSRSVHRAIAVSVLVQGLGSLAPLLTVVALARLAGPDVQGAFAAFKSWMDLVSSLVVFGFPQAFVYLINKGICSRGQLLNATFAYVALATLAVVPIAALSLALGYTVLPTGQFVLLHCLMLALGMGALFLQRLVRAIYLTVDDGFLFSLITSAPAFLLMVTVLIASLSHPFRYDVAFFAAGVLTLIAIWPWIARIVRDTPDYQLKLQMIPARPLADQSIQAFLQSVAFTLQPVIAIYLLQQQNAGLTNVAFFTASTIVVVGVNVLFGLVSPILFNRWSAALDAELFKRIGRMSLLAAAAFTVIGLVAMPLLPWVVPLVFGAEYGPSSWAFMAMAAAMGPVAYTRILYPAIHAAGRPGLNTVSCGVRLVSGCATQVVMSLLGYEPLSAAVWGWVIAEWAAALYSIHASRRLVQWMG